MQGDVAREKRAIAKLKDELDVNVELSSPAHFLPELSDWREMSPYVGTFGALEVYDYDLRAQALAKLSRGFECDVLDVHALLDDGAVTVDALREAFDAMSSRIIRFPRVSAEIIRARIEALASRGGKR